MHVHGRTQHTGKKSCAICRSASFCSSLRSLSAPFGSSSAAQTAGAARSVRVACGCTRSVKALQHTSSATSEQNLRLAITISGIAPGRACTRTVGNLKGKCRFTAGKRPRSRQRSLLTYSLAGPPPVLASVNLVPLLWTGVPTPSAPADRQDPLPIFRCPGNASKLRPVFPDHPDHQLNLKTATFVPRFTSPSTRPRQWRLPRPAAFGAISRRFPRRLRAPELQYRAGVLPVPRWPPQTSRIGRTAIRMLLARCAVRRVTRCSLRRWTWLRRRWRSLRLRR